MLLGSALRERPYCRRRPLNSRRLPKNPLVDTNRGFGFIEMSTA